MIYGRPLEKEMLNELDNIDVYPTTLVKFLLDRRRIVRFFKNAARSDFICGNVCLNIPLDKDQCVECRKETNVICKSHLSLKRVLRSGNVLLDIDTGLYFFRNEIFLKSGDNRLIVVYCPHTENIKGDINEEKILKNRKFIVVDDTVNEVYHQPRKIVKFSSASFMKDYWRCYFNKSLSIVLTPSRFDHMDWALIPSLEAGD